MSGPILVIGAGIIGASIAYHLSARGAQVTVLDQGLPATGASGSSFGWINANFVETPEYFRLRRAAIDAYGALEAAIDLSDIVRWTGCLWWEDEGKAMDAHLATLEAHGYEAKKVTAVQIAELEPALIAPPEAAVLSRIEGAADGARLTRKLLQEAARLGAQILPGCMVKELTLSGGRVTGAETEIGRISAAWVVIGAGVGTTALLEQAGVTLPVVRKTGAMLQTLPTAKCLNHVIMSPDVHAHQLSDGSLLIGEIFSGGAPSQMLCDDPNGFARDILARLERRVPALGQLTLAECRIGQRPVPADGFPAIGAIPSLGNAYVAVMHSGVTLAALVGQLAAKELLDGANCPQLSDFRPSRFGQTGDSMS